MFGERRNGAGLAVQHQRGQTQSGDSRVASGTLPIFPRHDPVKQVFDWHCQRGSSCALAPETVASDMKEWVFQARKLYTQPIGNFIPYGDARFRAAYLMAYFPYYIEPIWHVLQQENLPEDFFARDELKIGFFGGGPCPESLGVAAWLRQRAPRLKRIEATVFDRQPGWVESHQRLIPSMLCGYKSGNTAFTLKSKTCDVVECLARECSCDVFDKDIIIAQNFLSEIYEDRQQAMQTFERIVRESSCRYLVLVDNRYDQVKECMSALSAHLHARGLISRAPEARTSVIRPNFRLPEVLRQHLFTGEDGLIPRSNVKFHHLVIEIAR